MSCSETIVIGGGIVGAMCAYYLARSGRRVRLIDKAQFGSGCSHGNCGFVCPSHILPLAAPGAIGGALAALCRPNSPFCIKPRLSPDLWRWLLGFARRCNRRDMLPSAAARHQLLQSSMRLYRELLAEEAVECEWQNRGLLFVYLSQKEFEHYEQTDRLLRERFDLAATPYEGDELMRLEPALKPGLGGGWHYPHDAHLRPDKLLAEMRRVLQERGVGITEQCEVRSFVNEAGTARAVRTLQGDIEGEAFVVAAGALAPRLCRHLGFRMLLQPGKGYSITMPRPAQCPAIPMIFEQHRVAVTPMHSGLRLGSTMELAGYDESIRPRRLALLTSAAERYLQSPPREPAEEEWFGWRPLTADDKPYIGAAPASENVYVAAGHGMLGVSMAPATGMLIAQLAAGDPPHIDPRPFAPDRKR